MDERKLIKASERGDLTTVTALIKSGADINHTDYNANGNTALIRASVKGRKNIVELLLEKGAHIDMQNYNGDTALIHASVKGRKNIIELLLEKGAQIEIQDNYGYTALIRASEKGHKEVVELLLEKGAHIEMQNNNGNTALVWASYNRHEEVVELLLEKGAHIDVQNKYGNTALIRASVNGHKEFIELLLEKGAHVDMQNNKGDTALLVASELDQIIILLKKGADPNLKNKDGESALIKASKNGNINVVSFWLNNGALVNHQRNDGWSALMLASKCSFDVCKYLLQKGADPNLRNIDGESALMIASPNGNIEIVKLLLRNGALVNLQCNDGWSAVMLASKYTFDICKNLLKKGADPNLRNKDGKSALMIASLNGNIDIVKLLLKNGALVNLQCNDGWSALMLTRKYSSDVYEYLLGKGADPILRSKDGESALINASKNGHIDRVRLLLKKGVQINFQRNDGCSALMLASASDHIDLSKMLLENGAEINLLNSDGESALMMASKKGRVNTIRLLLKKGAEVNVQCNDGRSSLIIAVQNEHVTIVGILLKNNADTNLLNNGGWSSLMIACLNGHRELVKLLLDNGAKPDIAWHPTTQETNEELYHGWTALMFACLKGHIKIVQLLLEHGAELNLQADDGKSPLMVASIHGHKNIVKLVIEKGANLDLKDKHAHSALTYANEYKHIKISELLLSSGASINNERHTTEPTLSILQPSEKAILHEDASYPGLAFFEPHQERQITSTGITVDMSHVGIKISIPEGAVPEDKILNLIVSSCFNGPFELPEGYEAASPAYLIKHGELELLKDVQLEMEHFIKLQSEEDCECMMFLSASSKPEYKNSKPVYVFREMERRGKFKVGGQIGEIALRHFCLIRAGKKRKRKRTASTPYSKVVTEQRKECRLYSARLYRSFINNDQNRVLAVFCVCLLQKQYIKFCDKLMAEGFTGITTKAEGLTVFNSVSITEDVITVKLASLSGWRVDFNKTPQIYRGEVDLPETLAMSIDDLSDYPPKIVATFSPTITSPDNTTCKLNVAGLDRETWFKIQLKLEQQGYHLEQKDVNVENVNTKDMQITTEQLKQQVFTCKQDSDIVSCAKRMVDLMVQAETLLHSPSTIAALIGMITGIEYETHQIVQMASKVPGVEKAIHQHTARVETVMHQLRQVASVQLKHCSGSELDWKITVETLVINAANLMKAIGDVLRITETVPLHKPYDILYPKSSLNTSTETSADLCSSNPSLHSTQPTKQTTSDINKAPLNSVAEPNVEIASRSSVYNQRPVSLIHSATPPKSSLRLLDVYKELRSTVAHKWEDIGLLLGLTTGQLRIIKHDNPQDSCTCLLRMLTQWIDNADPTPSWSAIIEAIDLIGHRQLAEELKLRYAKC